MNEEYSKPQQNEFSTDFEVGRKMKSTNKPVRKGGFLAGFLGGILGTLLVLLVVASIYFIVTNEKLFGTKVSTTTDSNPTSTVQTVDYIGTPSQLTEVISNVKGSVVSIVNLQESGNFSNQTNDSGLITSSEGSGVIYKVDGDTAYIVTNNHVIDKAQELEVLLSDGTKVSATLVGADKWTDLAVIKISSEKVTTVAEFANSDQIVVGETVLAIGSPLGSEYATSVTQGIISATNRSVDSDIDGDGQGDWVMTAIQTDAAINPGNSGGALINQAGQIIGINSMKISDSSVEGMGFAIPSNEVISIINELEQNSSITRPVIGVSMYNIAGVSARTLENYDISTDLSEGIIVTDVVSGGTADEAGIQAYDVIVKINDKDVGTVAELRKELYSYTVGDTITVSFYRGNKLMEVDINLTNSTNPS